MNCNLTDIERAKGHRCRSFGCEACIKFFTRRERDFQCPKCLSIDAHVNYIESNKTQDQPEFLRCKCKRCKYLWNEETATS